LCVVDSGHSGCGGAGLLTHNNGVITSQPQFTANSYYQPNSHCTWRIHATAGNVIRLSSSVFNLEDDRTYVYNLVLIFGPKYMYRTQNKMSLCFHLELEEKNVNSLFKMAKISLLPIIVSLF